MLGRNWWLIACGVILLLKRGDLFNGESVELECPDECECYYFRVNWVTDCSESNLTQIPYSELSPNVYILDLNGNYITDVDPFPADIKMRRLQLADNLMTEIRREAFAELHYLIDADFSNNKIAKIDRYTFKGTTGFITLELQNNPLKPVEGPFLYCNTLLYLDISNCGLQKLNPNFFLNITSLSTLDIANNPLRIIDNNVFYPLNSLETLKMNNCNLSFIDNSAFSMQGNLKHLELSGNQLTTLMWSSIFVPLIRLEYLDIRKSLVTHLTQDTFENTNYLRILILAENDLSDIDVGLTIGRKLTHLDTLDLSHCHLSKLSEDAFANSTKIKTLYLSGNILFASDLLVALPPLVKLQKLSLSQCGLSVLPDTLHKFKSLIELDISYNPLNDVFVKILEPLESLEYLNMGYSNLSYISPTTFSKMTSMKRLILSGNDLNSLEAGLFSNLTHLESLELNLCGLSKPLNATVFFNNLTYVDLTELQLASNPLIVSTDGPLLPKQLSRIQILDLSNCNLTFLPQNAFYWTPNISTLILSGNHFSSPADLLFLKLLPQLEMIDLSYNKLSSISPKDISFNANVKKLKLIGNPWKCDCSIAELWDWALVEKANLGILEGATIAAEHITVGKTKRKKLLICNYDSDKPTEVIANKIRVEAKLARNLNTWSKYIKDSGCEISNRPSRSIDENFILDNNWAPNFITFLILYSISLILLYLLYLTLNRFHNNNKNNSDTNLLIKQN